MAAEVAKLTDSREDLLKKLRSGGMSHEHTLEESVIVLLGPYKAGKTTCAATISEYIPDVLPSPKLVELLDTYWLPFDTGALDCLSDQGLSAPAPYDLALHRKEKTLAKYLDKVYRGADSAVARAKKFADAGIVNAVVADTVSSFDSIICSYLEKQYEDANDNQRRAMWGEVARIHEEFYQAVLSVGVRCIFICHIKEIFEIISKNDGGASEAKAKNKRTVSMLPGKCDIQLKVTGQSAGLYKGHGSLILPVVKTIKGGNSEYNIFLQSYRGIEGGSRFLRGLDPKQPAHLGKLIEKIKANQAKPKEEAEMKKT